MRLSSRHLAATLLTLTLSASLLGCSGDDSTSSSSSGSSSSGASSSGASSSGAASSSGSTQSSSSSGGLPPRVTRLACYTATKKDCEMHGESSQSGIDSRKTDCTSEGGTPSDHCPSDGLVGCCVIAGLGQCSYDAATASSLQSACGAGGGKWQTSAP